MRWRRRRPPAARAPEDPDAIRVEAFLVDAARSLTLPEGPGEARPRVDDALWLCPRVSHLDAPVWLLCSTLDGAVAWCRVADGIEPLDLVDARSSCGLHVDPAQVLAWLEGRTDRLAYSSSDLRPEARALADRVRDRLTSPAG